MRFRLRTLMILAGVVPPALAFLWYYWRLVLIGGLCVALLFAWVAVSLAMARWFAGLVASVMD